MPVHKYKITFDDAGRYLIKQCFEDVFLIGDETYYIELSSLVIPSHKYNITIKANNLLDIFQAFLFALI